MIWISKCHVTLVTMIVCVNSIKSVVIALVEPLAAKWAYLLSSHCLLLLCLVLLNCLYVLALQLHFFFATHRGNLAYEANYCAGLRILDISGIKETTPDIKEVGYFDVAPDCDSPGFSGSWSSYPYFESGTIIVSSIERGLFVLKYTGQQWTCYMLCNICSVLFNCLTCLLVPMMQHTQHVTTIPAA